MHHAYINIVDAQKAKMISISKYVNCICWKNIVIFYKMHRAYISIVDAQKAKIISICIQANCICGGGKQ